MQATAAGNYVKRRILYTKIRVENRILDNFFKKKLILTLLISCFYFANYRIVIVDVVLEEFLPKLENQLHE